MLLYFICEEKREKSFVPLCLERKSKNPCESNSSLSQTQGDKKQKASRKINNNNSRKQKTLIEKDAMERESSEDRSATKYAEEDPPSDSSTSINNSIGDPTFKLKEKNGKEKNMQRGRGDPKSFLNLYRRILLVIVDPE